MTAADWATCPTPVMMLMATVGPVAAIAATPTGYGDAPLVGQDVVVT
jgi:hypothetical protein